MSGLFLPFYELCLILRQHLGIILIHTDDVRNGSCNTVAVPCHHYNFADSQLFQLTNDLGGFLSQRIFNADHGCQLAINRHVQMRVLFEKMIEQFLFALRDLCLLILKYEVVASDDNLLAL